MKILEKEREMAQISAEEARERVRGHDEAWRDWRIK